MDVGKGWVLCRFRTSFLFLSDVSKLRRIRAGCKPDPNVTYQVLACPPSTILDVLLLLFGLFRVDVGEVSLGEILKRRASGSLRVRAVLLTSRRQDVLLVRVGWGRAHIP